MTAHPYRTPDALASARALRLVHAPRLTKTLARMLLVGFGLVVLAFAVVPWQQSSTGTGSVIAYAPIERQQTVEAPIEGRVTTWHVREGDHVDAGDAICDLTDNDPDILVRLRQERDAQVARIEASKARRVSIESRVSSLGLSREASIAAAEQRVRMAQERTRGQERAREAAVQAQETAILNGTRQRSLFEGGLTSKRAVELAELEVVRTRTEVERAEATVRAASSEERALASDLAKAKGDVSAAIDDATATRSMVDAEIASAAAELARIEVRFSRQGAQAVKAPRAGVVLRVIARQGGEMVRAGDGLAVIVPDTSDRAAEIWIDGNDVPLVTPGRKVRVQFEGWPAVQFAGWPEMAIGTFGGVVAFVDAAPHEHTGKFRAVIVPDEPWPAPRYLRQGARVNGWIFLNRVRLGYEVWRQLNGFPAVVPTKEMLSEPTKGAKK
jgi:membrane fusion protein, adhesin transport system